MGPPLTDRESSVAAFWDVVIDSALTTDAIAGLLASGYTTIQGALSLGLMRRGYESGLIRFGLLQGKKRQFKNERHQPQEVLSSRVN